MRAIALTLCLFWTAIASGQDLFAWIDSEDQIIFQPRATDLLIPSWEIQSDGGHLTAPPRPAPFTFMLSSTSEQLTAGNLGAVVNIPQSGLAWGEYDLSAALDAGIDPCRDVRVFIGNGPTNPSFPVDPATSPPPRPAPPSASFCAVPGDVDFDGQVTFSDFLTLSDNFGMTGATWPDGDFDWDRTVGFTDFLALGANFEQSQPASAVPEPQAELLALIVAGIFLIGYRRSR